jgi:membrane protease YdiL (CAAX protease family)
LHQLFVGPHGVRAGWRLLLAYALYRAMAFAVSPLAVVLAPAAGAEFTPGTVIRAKIPQLLAIAVTTFVLTRVERRSVADYGPRASPHRGGVRLLIGAAQGAAAVSWLIAVLAIVGVFHASGGSVLSPADAVRFALGWAAAYLIVGAQEELLFRGYLLRTLSDGLRFWPAAAISSLLFVRAHVGNEGESMLGLFGVFVLGVMFCAIIWRTSTLWIAIGFHAAWDFAESFVYSVPNSGIAVKGHLLDASMSGPDWLTGGAAGPEGSVVCVILAVALTIVLAGARHDARGASTR